MNEMAGRGGERGNAIGIGQRALGMRRSFDRRRTLSSVATILGVPSAGVPSGCQSFHGRRFIRLSA